MQRTNVELAQRYSRLTRGEDAHKCWNIYSRFHSGENGCDVLIEDFVIFRSVAEEIIELAQFLKDHPDCVTDDIYTHYSKLTAARQE